MITKSYQILKSVVYDSENNMYVVKHSFDISNLKDLDGLKTHFNELHPLEYKGYIYFCQLIDSVEFEEVTGE